MTFYRRPKQGDDLLKLLRSIYAHRESVMYINPGTKWQLKDFCQQLPAALVSKMNLPTLIERLHPDVNVSPQNLEVTLKEIGK
jgi:hypothetical protein